MRFLRQYRSKTDAKEEPSCLQSSAGAQRIRRGIVGIAQRYLRAMPSSLSQSVWNERMDALRKRLSRWSRRDQMIYRQYVTDVEMITLDGNGHFLIPKRYLKMAKYRPAD